VLHQGKIFEQGNHQELLAMNAFYSSLLTDDTNIADDENELLPKSG
jgi:ABC-type transport system involved in cytochrome bd biosynthesis fused ATPase/permease subunit